MFEFLSTYYGMISAAIFCVTVLVTIFILTGKHSGVEVSNGKIKFAGTKESNESPQAKVIRFDDWKQFSVELYEFCLKMLKPDDKYLYAILHNYEDVLSPSKKAYVERFIYFNHLPEYKSEKYNEYIAAHSNAIITSVYRSMKLICCNYTKEIPEFDNGKISKSLSRLVEKYRNREKEY